MAKDHQSGPKKAFHTDPTTPDGDTVTHHGNSKWSWPVTENANPPKTDAGVNNQEVPLPSSSRTNNPVQEIGGDSLTYGRSTHTMNGKYKTFRCVMHET